MFMSAAPAAAVQPNHPDPHQDWRTVSLVASNHTVRFLTLVRALIEYGRQLAATLQQRTAATDLTDFTWNFGTIDIAAIVACITRGLLRAAALEARLASRLTREQAAAAACRAPSRRQPRAAAPAERRASTADPRLARLPTPAEIAAQVRHRPIGAVIADICRDLGIVASHPLWREIFWAIIAGNGSLATLYRDMDKRLGAGMKKLLAAMHPEGLTARFVPFEVAFPTGPPYPWNPSV